MTGSPNGLSRGLEGFLPFITSQNTKRRATLKSDLTQRYKSTASFRSLLKGLDQYEYKRGTLETDRISIQGGRTFCKTNKEINEQANKQFEIANTNFQMGGIDRKCRGKKKKKKLPNYNQRRLQRGSWVLKER